MNLGSGDEIIHSVVESRAVAENSTGMGRQGQREWGRGPRDDEGKITVRPQGQEFW